MNAQEFAYWLNGFAELQVVDTPPTTAQWKSIKEHLKLTFTKVTPEVNVTTVTPTQGLGVKDLEELVKRINNYPMQPSTPYEPYDWTRSVTTLPYTPGTIVTC
jgi:hypothetical protein